MKRYDQYCPIAHALGLVGERWSLLVVRELMDGPKRYTDLVAGLPKIGTNILAAAGLLDGHRATTHWGTAAQLAADFPLVTVDPDPLFVRSDRIWTSAGMAASIDLALALVGDDHGDDFASKLAQSMVMYAQRPGGQSQFSAALSLPAGSRTDIAELRRWMSAHPPDRARDLASDDGRKALLP